MVDTQGIADDAVDVDGWSYATDFGWLHMPPAAGSGRFRKVELTVKSDHLPPTCITFTAKVPCSASAIEQPVCSAGVTNQYKTVPNSAGAGLCEAETLDSPSRQEAC